MTTQDELQTLREQVELLQARVNALETSEVDLPFPSRIKYRERHEREEFFYKVFRALSFNAIGGDYVEFGCHGGTTFCFAYHQAKLHKHKAEFWAFDSFQGFPEHRSEEDDHPKWQKGRMHTSIDDFHKICQSRGVPKDAYTATEGFFSESLAKFGPDEGPTEIALAFIDCDLYSSTMDVLDFLGPRIKHGTVLAFDDYFCWSETQPAGEMAAMLEYFKDKSQWELVPYLQFGWHGLAFIVHARK